jgi:oligopeptide transport system substrate-binding protein
MSGVTRRIFYLLGVAMAFSACARRATLVETATRDHILLMGNKDEPADLDPAINAADSTNAILHALFEGLVEFENDGRSIRPGVAERWEVSADGLTWTFHLRQNARWSNGEPVTASDFRDSFLRVIDPKVGGDNASDAYTILGARAFAEGRRTDAASVGIRVPDLLTLVIRVEHPAPYLLTLLAQATFYPVYGPSLDANGGRSQRAGRWTLPGALVGNGPFTLAEWVPNAYLSVKRNPFFWDARRIRLRGIRFFPTDDEGAEERAFRAGQLHLTYRIPKSKVPVYQAANTGVLHLLPILRTNYITFNVGASPFTDPRVRRAFSLAIDREKLVHAALGGLGTPAYSFVRPGTGGFLPSKGFRFDPSAAAALMAAAGYPGGAGFPPVELTLNGKSGSTLEVGEVLQQMWLQHLGAHVTLRPLEFKVYLSVERERQFQVLFEGFTGYPDPRQLLQFPYTSDPNNDAGASNPAYDSAFDAADRMPSEGRRLAAFDALEAINAREVYFAPIFFSNRGLLIDKSVHGWRDNGIEEIDWRQVYLEP